MLSSTQPQHTPWFSPQLMARLAERITALRAAIVKAEGAKIKDKYALPLQELDSLVEQLNKLNEQVQKKGYCKRDAEGRPLIKNRELQFIDELDDPNLNTIFNGIKNQTTAMINASKNLFKKDSPNHVLAQSLLQLCEEFFNKHHRNSKQELEKRFFVEYFLGHQSATAEEEKSSGKEKTPPSYHAISPTELAQGSDEEKELSNAHCPFQTESEESSWVVLGSLADYLAKPEVQAKLASNKIKVTKQEDQGSKKAYLGRLFNDFPDGMLSNVDALVTSFEAIYTLEEKQQDLSRDYQLSTWANLAIAIVLTDLFDDNIELRPELKQLLGADFVEGLYRDLDSITVNNALACTYLVHLFSVLSADPRIQALHANNQDVVLTIGQLSIHYTQQLKTDSASIQTYRELMKKVATQPLLPILKLQLQALSLSFKHGSTPSPTLNLAEAETSPLQERLTMLEQELAEQKAAYDLLNTSFNEQALGFNNIKGQLERAKAREEKLSSLENDYILAKAKIADLHFALQGASSQNQESKGELEKALRKHELKAEAQAQFFNKQKNDYLSQIKNLEQAQQKLEVQNKQLLAQKTLTSMVHAPDTTPWWHYALGVAFALLGLLALATGLAAFYAVPLLVFELGSDLGLGLMLGGLLSTVMGACYTAYSAFSDASAKSQYELEFRVAHSPVILESILIDKQASASPGLPAQLPRRASLSDVSMFKQQWEPETRAAITVPALVTSP